MNARGEYRRTLIVVRYLLPGVLVLVGLALALGGSGATAHGGMGIIGAGLAAFLFAFLAKVSMSGDTHVRRDDENRSFFDEHGYWPDEDPSRARR